MLNFMLKVIQKRLCGMCAHSQRYGKHVRLQGMLLTANGDSIMQTQYKYAPVDNILDISCVIKPKAPRLLRNQKARRDGLYGWPLPSTLHPYSASRASVSPSIISSATGAWPPKSVRAYSKTPTDMARTSSRPGRKTTRCV